MFGAFCVHAAPPVTAHVSAVTTAPPVTPRL